MPTFLKPAWINHQGTPIYSIDIHPNGSRIATGGGDNKVKLWNIEPVRSEEKEKDKTVPKLLASMGNHLNAVNSVRWSHNGQHLASGSDDKTAFIWEITSSGGSISNAFGEQDDVVEVWKPIWALRGHDCDVLDVQWSPDDSLLATAGVDNFICVWNVATGTKLTKLEGHKGMVKGLTWDPVGRYLASQSDDKSVIIWRTSDWQKETTIEEFYKKNTEKDFFRRLSWSPDGSLIATTNAFANDTPVAAIIERDKWTKNVDFVGHTKPIGAARFSDAIFEVSVKKKKSTMKYCCCALGSMDKSFSVWATNSGRPIFVAANAFHDIILDLSWAGDGRTLVACSMDGTVAYVEFTVEEIGVPMSKERQRKVMSDSYGIQYRDGKAKSLFSKSALIESPDQLQFETSKFQSHGLSNKTAATSSASMTQDVVSTSAPQSANLPQALSEQKETRTSDGRRRIQPVVLSTSVAPIRTNSFSSLSTTSFQPAFEPEPLQVRPRSPSPTPLDQEPVVTSVKRKRSSPILVSQPKKAKNKHSSHHDNKSKEKQTPPSSRDRRDHHDRSEKSDRSSSTSDKTKDTPSRTPSMTPQRGVVRLPAAEIKDGKLTFKLKTKGGEESIIEATYSSTDCLTHIRTIANDQSKWEDHIRGKVCVMTGNDNFIAVGCNDGSIQVYSPFGRRLLPAITTGYPLSSLDANESYHLLAVTTDATVHVWNISELKSTVTVSLGSLVDPPLSIVRTKITEDGQPVIQLSNYEAFVYHEPMKSWLRIADNKFTGSEYNTLISRIGNEEQRPLSLLRQLQEQSGKKTELALVSRMTAKQHVLETRAHLENQMGCALVLKSKPEYLIWSEKYVRSLVEAGDAQRLDEYCGSLAASASGATAATDLMLSISKSEIIQQFRSKYEPLIASNRSLQRIREKYGDIFQTLESTQRMEEGVVESALRDA